MTLPLAIWTTGDPVPAAEASQGNFFEMIRRGVGEAFSGKVLDVNAQGPHGATGGENVSGIIVSGSPARLNDGLEWMKRTEEALLRAHERGVPILGICFGHQLLGEALGGTVAPNPCGREIGTIDLVVGNQDPLLAGIASPPIVVMTHLDSVLTLPHGTEVLGTTELEKHAALRFSETTWGVQFHPEMNAETIGFYLEARRADIEAEGLSVDTLLTNRRPSDYGTRLLQRFGRFCQMRRFDEVE